MRVSGVRSSFSNADENTQRKRNREAPFRFLATLIRPCDIFILDAFLYFFNKYIFDFAVDVGRISRTFMSVYMLRLDHGYFTHRTPVQRGHSPLSYSQATVLHPEFDFGFTLNGLYL